MTAKSAQELIEEMIAEAKSKGITPDDIFIAIVDPNSRPGQDYLRTINRLSGTPLPEDVEPSVRRFLSLNRRQAEGLVAFMARHGYPVVGATRDLEWSVISVTASGARIGGPSDDLLN